ncbi:MAG: hypothetical protein AAFV26_10415 [Pseudomonadota bacterium]
MLAQILFLDLVSKAVIGGLLLLFPITTARVFGLPHGQVGLWARLLGAQLLGIALAIYIEHDNQMNGLGLTGLIGINIATMLVLLTFTVAQGAGTKRGTALLWFLTIGAFGLSVLQIAQLDQP